MERYEQPSESEVHPPGEQVSAGPRPDLQLSPSMQQLGSELQGDVTAFAVAATIVRSHTDYAGGQARTFTVSPGPPDVPVLPVSEWLLKVRELHDTNLFPKLFGKVVLLGLALLEPALWMDLSRNGFRSALDRDTHAGTEHAARPWDDGLSPQGKKLLIERRWERDNTQPRSDDAALEDRLRREPLARALAIRLDRLWRKEVKNGEAYLVHVYGPWGSGKSTLLNLLEHQLRLKSEDGPSETQRQPQNWIVVRFNAWQHQRMGEPWWWLINAAYRQGSHQLFTSGQPLRWLGIVLSERLWRLTVRRLAEAITFLILGSILAVAIALGLVDVLLSTPLGANLEQIQNWSRGAAAIVALLGVLISFSRLFELRSLRSARRFLDASSDPLSAICRHYQALLKRFGPVVVFIDDLDRCQSPYVLGLLEGIQTLFRDAPAIYVVAAERHWLRACYEKAYADFALTVDEPGKPLGDHFLEKIFQLSVPVPVMSNDVRQSYFRHLLNAQSTDPSEAIKEASERARRRVAGLSSAAAVEQQAGRVKSQSLEDKALNAELVVRLARDDVELRVEHRLLHFQHLVEPNPRAMKKLVNTYGILRTIAILAGVDIGMELGLWTIVSLRWPLLAEFLTYNPSGATLFANPPPTTAPVNGHEGVQASEQVPLGHQHRELLITLASNPAVRIVFDGFVLEGQLVRLDAASVEACATLVRQAPANVLRSPSLSS